MKMSKILLVFMIGLISLNVIFAGTTSKTFLIKGDLAINSNLTSRCGLGLDWGQSPETIDHDQVDQTSGGSAFSGTNDSDTLYFALAANSRCKLEIYTPNNTTTPIYSKSNLNASAIKFGLNQGIVIGPVTITSTEQTINFIVKVKGQNTSNQYTDELLTTTIRVPNPNSEDTVVAADTADNAVVSQKSVGLINTTTTNNTCNADNYSNVSLLEGTLVRCGREPNEAGGYRYSWSAISSGGTSGGGLQSADFNPLVFYKCPPAGCYVGSVLVHQLAGKMSLRNNAITNQYIAPGAISLSNLSQDVLDYMASLNTTNVTNVTTEVTEIIGLDSDSVDYDHLNIDLKNRLGDIEELDSGAASALTTISNKFYAVHDQNTGDVYYIPVKTSTEFQIDAIRNLVTLSSFDNENFEKKTGSSFSSNYPPEVGLKYSDFLYPRTDRKYASLNKYIPIDVEIRKGATQQFNIEFFECVQLYSDREGLGEKLSATFVNSYCTPINNSRIKGTTLNENLTFSGNAVLADVSGTYNKKYHVRLSNNNTKKAIVTKITNPNASPPKSVYEVSAGMVHIYDEISDVALTSSPTTCAYVVNTAFPPFTQTRYIMTFPHLQFTVTGGSSNSTASGKQKYFTWDIEAYVTGDDISNKVSLASSKVDNRRTGLSNATFSSFVSPANDNPVNIIVTIKDNRTGQRFAKTFAITGCTSTPQ